MNEIEQTCYWIDKVLRVIDAVVHKSNIAKIAVCSPLITPDLCTRAAMLDNQSF